MPEELTTTCMQLFVSTSLHDRSCFCNSSLFLLKLIARSSSKALINASMATSSNRPDCDEEGENICPICMCETTDPKEATPCKHAFCETCLGRWMQTKLSLRQLATCPVCRTALQNVFMLKENVVDGQQYAPFTELDFMLERDVEGNLMLEENVDDRRHLPRAEYAETSRRRYTVVPSQRIPRIPHSYRELRRTRLASRVSRFH